MLKIALSGCNGRMGRVISDICSKKEEVSIVAGFDIVPRKLSEFPVYSDPFEFSGKCDVIIDFSNASSTEQLLKYCLKTKTPIVISTTGHSEEQLKLIDDISKQIPVFRSGNMSVGINLVMDLLQKCAKVLGDGFDVEIIEKHHNQKLDAPSGTALMLADAVASSLPYEAEYTYDRHEKREKRSENEIGIHAVRGGTIVGEHEVIFAGRDEIIEIKHTALSREVFAVGAVDAAVFLAKQTIPGKYNMTNVINSK